MPEHLVVTLTASLGAMGDLAGHERRGTAPWPARSAILGLLGAALGIDRQDETGQGALASWRMATGLLGWTDARRRGWLGQPLRDYHTVQTVPSGVRRPRTRRDALVRGRAEGRLATVLTTRDYVTGCAFLVALWGGDLAAAGAALRRPVFVPYFGRKACPLDAPLDPKVVEASTPVEALTRPRELPPWLVGLRVERVATDHFPGVEAWPGRVVETRWDEPRDRRSWHFGPREVSVLTLPPPETAP